MLITFSLSYYLLYWNVLHVTINRILSLDSISVQVTLTLLIGLSAFTGLNWVLTRFTECLYIYKYLLSYPVYLVIPKCLFSWHLYKLFRIYINILVAPGTQVCDICTTLPKPCQFFLLINLFVQTWNLNQGSFKYWI